MQENPNRVFVLEKDRFREIWGFLPHGTVQQEAGIVWAIDGAAIQLLRHGATVVIDATNLSSWDMEHWQGVALYVGAEFECVDFTHVSIEECKENVRKRVSSGGRYVGDEIIDALAERAGLIKRNSNE
jgi:predicted kinase